MMRNRKHAPIVDEGGGLQRIPRAFASHIPGGQTAQHVVHQRHQAIAGLALAPPEAISRSVELANRFPHYDQFTLVFANAPIDRYARGDPSAMSLPEKKGALLFFGSAGCVHCHAVSRRSNEMFSDFEMHVVGVPQIAPGFGPVPGT